MDEVISYVERSNQRGGRMLSVIDLIEAGTLSLAAASWLLYRIEAGDSWLVGAKPGGAGKTTIMSALLAMVPGHTKIYLTNTGSGWRSAQPGDCIVSYEISPGFYDAYLWGEDVAQLVRLGLKGCRIVSNLHADTLEEAREQVVHLCGASEQGFGAFRIFLPIANGRGFQAHKPRIDQIYLFDQGGWSLLPARREPCPREVAIADFLQACLETGKRTIQQVRQAWLA